MDFKEHLGTYAEQLVAQFFTSRDWRVQNLNQLYGRKFPWGDLYMISPAGFSLFLSVKGRTSYEHQPDETLIWNPRYDGKGEPQFRNALTLLANRALPVDGVGWVAASLNIDQTFSAHLGLLDQMVLVGKKQAWSIPMRPIDRGRYHCLIERGTHNFNWSEYSQYWFSTAHRRWQTTGILPAVVERVPGALRCPFLPSTSCRSVFDLAHVRWNPANVLSL